MKRIELIFKRAIGRLLLGSKTPQRIESPVISNFVRQNCKILLLRQDRIGDVLISVPFVRALRYAIPSAEIDVLFGRRNIFAKRALEKYIDNAYVYSKHVKTDLHLISKIKKKKYDIAIDLFDNSSVTSSLLMRVLNMPVRIGIEKENSAVYTHIVPLLNKRENHIVSRVNMLLLPFGIDVSTIDNSLEYPLCKDTLDFAEANLPKLPGKLRLGINLSGSSRAKYWGVSNHIRLIESVNSEFPFLDVVLFGSKDYSQDINEIVSLCKCTAAPFVSSMHLWAALLNTCDVLITPDTAAVHLASAWKKPVIALYNVSGRSFAGMPWYPISTIFRAIETEQDELSTISHKDVFCALKEILTSIKVLQK